MKYQVREGRNRVIILALCALSLLVFILAASTVVTGALAWHFAKTQRTITTPMMFDRPFTSGSASGDAALNGMLVRSFINPAPVRHAGNCGQPARRPAALRSR